MKVDIFDVGHGHCSLITAPNGQRIMLDCGYQSDPGWWPSIHFLGEHIDLLAALNLDEDHVGDLEGMLKWVSLGGFYSNPTVTASALAAMKAETGGMRNGVATAHSLLATRGPIIGTVPIDGGEVIAQAFFNRYVWDFVDTNNLSLAVFAFCRGVTVLFAGDLETAGWRKLLERPDFQAWLRVTRIIVAAHHGRENGLCDEVFKFCRPDIVIISDDEKQYDSQETHPYFYARTKGIPVLGTGNALTGPEIRSVYTTRSDGKITIDVNVNGGYLVTPERARRPRLPVDRFALPLSPPIRNRFSR